MGAHTEEIKTIGSATVKKREALLVTHVPQAPPMFSPSPAGFGTRDIVYISVIGSLIIALSLSVYLFYSERQLRFDRETKLQQKISELSERDVQILKLIQENSKLQTEYKSKLEELQFTLKALNDSFDILLSQKKSTDADNDSKAEIILDLQRRVDRLEADKSKLADSLRKVEMDKQALLLAQSADEEEAASAPKKKTASTKETFLGIF